MASKTSGHGLESPERFGYTPVKRSGHRLGELVMFLEFPVYSFARPESSLLPRALMIERHGRVERMLPIFTDRQHALEVAGAAGIRQRHVVSIPDMMQFLLWLRAGGRSGCQEIVFDIPPDNVCENCVTAPLQGTLTRLETLVAHLEEAN